MIATVAELEACLGAPGLGAQLKAIDRIDSHAARWIAASPLGALVVAGAGRKVTASLAGGEPGFAHVESETRLTLPLDSVDRIPDAAVGDGAALLFFATDVTETLRVNGRVASIDDTRLTVDVEEVYVHCGKALIRSAFWAPAETSHGAMSALPGAARFCVFGSADADGRADASPKGDPENFIGHIDAKTLVLPDRSGNRRADGHRNVLAQDHVALIAFKPGATAAFTARGRARLSNDTKLREQLAVEGKAPVLATLIHVTDSEVYESRALTHARIWDADRRAGEKVNSAATLAAHIKTGSERGPHAQAKPLVIPEAVIEESLAKDYREKLY